MTDGETAANRVSRELTDKDFEGIKGDSMRDVTVRDMQNAVADIKLFSQSELCPGWAISVVSEIGYLLESILSAREFPRIPDSEDRAVLEDVEYHVQYPIEGETIRLTRCRWT